jgi:hypothetical protein
VYDSTSEHATRYVEGRLDCRCDDLDRTGLQRRHGVVQCYFRRDEYGRRRERRGRHGIGVERRTGRTQRNRRRKIGFDRVGRRTDGRRVECRRCDE